MCFFLSGQGWSFTGLQTVLKGTGSEFNNGPKITATFVLTFNPQTVTILQVGYRVENINKVSSVFLSCILTLIKGLLHLLVRVPYYHCNTAVTVQQVGYRVENITEASSVFFVLYFDFLTFVYCAYCVWYQPVFS